MISKIGERIKELRKAKGITQEDLAKYLNVSFQAISKWENGISYPDITIVPAVANFFSVTTDELFGMKEQEIDDKIDSILAEYHQNYAEGLIDHNETILREALKELPGNFKLMSALSNTLFSKLCARGDSSVVDEIIENERLVLKDSTDDDLRHSAIQLLVYCYDRKGDKEKAKDYARKLPTLINQERLLVGILCGDEQTLQLQSNILSDLDMIGDAVYSLSRNCLKEKQFEDARYYLTVQKRLFEIVFENGDYHFYHERFVPLYLQMAKIELTLGHGDDAVTYIQNAMKHAIAFDELPEKAAYTSRCLNRLVHHTQQIAHNNSETLAATMLEQLTQKVFDPIRSREDFGRIIDNLQGAHTK